MRANLWNAVLFAGKREICVLSVLVMLLIGSTFLTHQTFGQSDSLPVPPSDLAAASDGGNALRIMWADNSSDEDNFVIERKIGTLGTWATIATRPADTIDWRDDNTANLYNTPYIYRVKAINGSGSSSWTSEVGAVTQPSGAMQCAIVTGRDIPKPLADPAPPLPLKHQVIRNDLSYLRMMRLTDESDGFFNTTAYAYWTTFNSNNTRIFIINGSGQGFLYQMNPDSFTITEGRTPLTDPTLEVEGLTWSKTNPNLVYATTRPTGQNGQISGQLRQYNVATNTRTEVREYGDFTQLELRGGVLTQMSVSENNDNTFAWELKNACPSPTASCLTVDKGSYYFTWTRGNSPSDPGTIKRGLFIQNRLVPNPDPTAEPRYVNDYNEVHVSKNGNYLLRALVDPERRDLLDLTTATPMAESIVYLSHFDLGTNFLVGSDNNGSFPLLRKVDFTTPGTSSLLFTYKDWRQESYSSLLADNDNENQVLISQYQVVPAPSNQSDIENMKREIFLLSTNEPLDNGNRPVKRLAHHYSVNWDNNKICPSESTPSDPVYNCYRSRVHANISRDGKFVAFTSSWGVFSGRTDVFILKTSCDLANAATVSVGGRVVSHTGNGIYKARLTLLDSSGQTRLALTNQFGNYNFEDVPVGSTIVSAYSRGYTFGQPVQALNVSGNLTDINFTAMAPNK